MNKEMCLIRADKFMNYANTNWRKVQFCQAALIINENLFSQQRGIFQGNNTNPTYLIYCQTINSVILRQPSISRKSYAADTKASADPIPL